MANFDSGRLGALFRQRAQIAGDMHQAGAIAERLTLEHNQLVRRDGRATLASARRGGGRRIAGAGHRRAFRLRAA